MDVNNTVTYAIISDIHGNFPALSAVAADARERGVDGFILAGDYVFDMPYHNEVVEFIRGLPGAHIVAGNKEGYLSGFKNRHEELCKFDQFSSAIQVFRELSCENLDYLMNLPKSAEIYLPGGTKAWLTHFVKDLKTYGSNKFRIKMEESPFTHEDYLTWIRELLDKPEAKTSLEGIDAKVVIVGHSHQQWHGYCGDKLVINPGSCGQPLDFDTRASYTLLRTGAPSGGVQFHVEEIRVEYDIETVIRDLRKSEQYKRGGIWSELVIKMLKTGAENILIFFGIADIIARGKGETDKVYTNETWREAGRVFFERYDN